MSSTSPTQRNAQAKLEHILRHSAQIFANQGFEGTSVREISRATGVSLSGLYYYFESKQELLYLIQNNTFHVVIERLRIRLQGVADPQSRLRVFIQNHVEYFLSHPNEMKVLSHEEEALNEPYRTEVAAIKRQYYGLAREIYNAVASESLPSRISGRVAVLSLFGMMNWVYKWHRPDVDPGANELTDAILGIFLHGVSPVAAEANELSAAGSRTIDSV